MLGDWFIYLFVIFLSIENIFMLKFSLTLFHLSLIMLLRGREVRSMLALWIWSSFYTWIIGRERRGSEGMGEDTCDLGEVGSNTTAWDGGRRNHEML